MNNPKCYHLSASSIAAFKTCPMKFRLNYREGLRTVTDTDSQRVGTNWHKMHEVYAIALVACVEEGPPQEKQDRALSGVITLLNEKYTGNIPPSKTETEWALEREVLFQSFIGYLWRWSNDPIQVLASELPFNLPLINPRVGLPLPMEEVQRVGKIDHIIRWQGMVGGLERKSTSRSIVPDSDYWEKGKKDTQVSMYALAFQELHAAGQIASLPPLPLKEGEPMPSSGNTLYDVWHKPTIKPTDLTQAETKAFIETGEYCDQKFTVQNEPQRARTQPSGEDVWEIYVDGSPTLVTMGKKGFSIKESVAMFGARLLQDIYARPDFYYQRREIVRTDEELREFQDELFAVYQAQKAFERTGCWFSNEQQCRATFACPNIPICYGPGAKAVCDGRTTPNGFKRIFVDFTVRGNEVEG